MDAADVIKCLSLLEASNALATDEKKYTLC